MRKTFLVASLAFALAGCGSSGGGQPDNPVDGVRPIDEVVTPTPDVTIPSEKEALSLFNENVAFFAAFQNIQIQPVVAGPMAYAIANYLTDVLLADQDNNLIPDIADGQSMTDFFAKVNKSAIFDIASKGSTDIIESGKLYAGEYKGVKYPAFDIPVNFVHDSFNKAIASTFYATEYSRDGSAVKNGVWVVTIEHSDGSPNTFVEFQVIEKKLVNQKKVTSDDPTYLDILNSGFLAEKEFCQVVTSDGTNYDWSPTFTFNVDFSNPNHTTWWNSNIETDMEQRPVVGEAENAELDGVLNYFSSASTGINGALKYNIGDDFDVIPLSGNKFEIHHEFKFFSRTLGKEYNMGVVLTSEINGAGGFINTKFDATLIDPNTAGAEAVPLVMNCTP